MWESMGMYGAAFDAASQISSGIETKLTNEDKEKQLNEDQVRLAVLVSVFELGALGGTVPADLKFAIRRELNKQKKTAKKRPKEPVYYR